MKQETTLHIIMYLAIVGLLVSVYLTALFYQHTSTVCDINTTLSCSKVSSSKYSSLFGIPVSIFGILGYLTLAATSFVLLRKKFSLQKEKKVRLIQLFLGFSIIALMFSLYLTYIEFAILKAICIFCIASQIIILCITFFAYIYYTKALESLKD
jgi:uncharacterized membrane protein